MERNKASSARRQPRLGNFAVAAARAAKKSSGDAHAASRDVRREAGGTTGNVRRTTEP